MKLRTTLIYPDLHIGSQDKAALRCAVKLQDWLSPDRVVILGDWLEVHSASAHGASDRREAQVATYREEINDCRALLSLLESMPGVQDLVYIEGNHEQRVERWAVSHGRFAKEIVDLIAPRTALAQGRERPFTWVPYKDEDKPGYIEIAPGLIACHGWSTAKHAAHAHLRRTHGLSVVHGHTHRRQSYVERHPLDGRAIEAHSPGCLAKLHPMWVNAPTDWTHGVAILQERGDRWSLFLVPINEGVAITPCGAMIEAGTEDSVLEGVA